ncbi:biotin carboxyl carrier protein [Paraburkholderia sp. GAS199]|uniref:hypothetical protein n=1 Tax=Paraburkholderia sp. GAS199 TaxID=3035126 RepID=UPI003D1DF57E
MTLDDIDRILTRLDATDVTECVIENGSETLRVKFDRATDRVSDAIQTKPAAVAVEARTAVANAPASGLFRSVHPLVHEDKGDGSATCAVRAGQHVGYVEVDSIFCAILAPADGIRKTVLVDEGELIGYGQTIVELSIDTSEAAGHGND